MTRTALEMLKSVSGIKTSIDKKDVLFLKSTRNNNQKGNENKIIKNKHATF